VSNKPSTKPPVPVVVPFSDSGSAHAPILFFDEVPTFGHSNGIVRITLEAFRLYAKTPEKVESDRVVVAHLRMNLATAKALINALEGAILMATPAETETKN
jgi:hypothetical protein